MRPQEAYLTESGFRFFVVEHEVYDHELGEHSVDGYQVELEANPWGHNELTLEDITQIKTILEGKTK